MKNLLYFYLSASLVVGLWACQAKKNKTEVSDEIKDIKLIDYDCRNCGMPSKEYPKWHTIVTTERDEEIHFCSPRCMFISFLDEKKKPDWVKEVSVVEYYEGKRIDGKKAWYVVNSDVIGPMGHDFVPFKTADAAKDFLKEHKGKKILHFEEVTLKELKEVINTNK
ncbi:MAG: nitrous oxide reductase accessory protein NosL [Microscillaceae bacterium]|nr:nitrous oxide reductase accessory protein NosL [Microscillaceae bacterium]MDW8461949.1 nitrous oxide reductase accessory protein NosL [Cytophagales bacterium]